MGTLGMIGLLAACAGLAGLIRARRPRANPDGHPHCYHCDFDLFGLAVNTTRCPECGADLVSARVTIPRPRRPLALASFALLITGLTAFQVNWFGLDDPYNLRHLLTSAQNWSRRNAPTFWLARGVPSNSITPPDLGELFRRLRDGELSDARARALVTAALNHHARPTTPTTAPAALTWPPVIETARARGLLSDEQFHRYLTTSLSVGLAARPKVRQGDPFPLSITLNSRAAYNYRFAVRTTLRPSEASPSATTGPSTGVEDPTFPVSAHDPLSNILLDPAATAALPPGPHRARVDATIDVYEVTVHRSATRPLLNPPTRTHVLTVTTSAQTDWQLLPASQPSVTLVAPADATTAPATQPFHFPEVGFGTGPPNSLNITAFLLPPPGPPDDRADRVFVRAAGREWPAGYVLYRAARRSPDFRLTAPAPGFPDKLPTVEVILRPDPALATDTIDITRIDGREVVYTDVPVTYPYYRYPGAAPAPANSDTRTPSPSPGPAGTGTTSSPQRQPPSPAAPPSPAPSPPPAPSSAPAP